MESTPVIFTNEDYIDALKPLDEKELADLFITSGVRFSKSKIPANAFTLEDVPGVAVASELALGKKCERCWKILDEVGSISNHPEVCPRCADAADHYPGPLE